MLLALEDPILLGKPAVARALLVSNDHLLVGDLADDIPLNSICTCTADTLFRKPGRNEERRLARAFPWKRPGSAL